MKLLERISVLNWFTRIGLALVGGLSSSLAFPRENLSPIIIVSVVALFLSVYQLKVVPAFVIGFIGGLCFYLSQIEWMSLYLGPVPWIALSTLEAFIFAVGMSAVAFVWRGLSSAKLPKHFGPAIISLSLATIWTAREWVSISLPYGGFPWSRLAQTQSDTFLAKWVYWGGLGLLTFVLAFISASVAVVIVGRVKLRSPGMIPVFGFVLLSLAVPALTQIDPGAQTGTIRVGAVQGNANAGLFANPERGSILKNHLDASKGLDKGALDVVVWPENASDLSPYSDQSANRLITDFVDNQIGVPLIFGTITQRGESLYNSSILWRPGLGATDWYDKKRPVPFAEYVPDRDFWYQLAPDLIGLVNRGYEFGERDGIFEIDKAKLGALICFEIAIDDIGRDLVQSGVQVILSQTNNADFGRSDQTFQQAAFASLRAIETGRTVINVSTVGVSAIFNADGSVVSQLPTFEAGVMQQE
ncbi:MAG: apolipoprotein N-acyltransferase, partial [Actinobacteria bacterium]|nr:apolipoprotein N-acyltransferase [Actinomycetota bacterium]